MIHASEEIYAGKYATSACLLTRAVQEKGVFSEFYGNCLQMSGCVTKHLSTKILAL